ncbi:uncharacterized protein LOC134577644 [Pelobates fuscus]|uniref:uncharacterized protein LOC134577644 n=1 Tax=Pelobates fuscus TaxID=191477 RepID=UPI002FE4814F
MEDSQISTECSSGPPDSFTPPESLSVTVAFIGPKGSGKSTLVRELSQQAEQFSPGFLDSYFKGEEGSHGVTHNPYPPLPNVALLDYAGYEPSDSIPLYLDGIKLATVDCVVVTLGESVTDADLQLLEALKKLGRPYFIVQTHTDLALHTQKRQLGKNYWRGQALQGLRDRLVSQIVETGLQGNNVFLVSCLEPQMFDFSIMVDYLETEILQWTRSVNYTPESQCTDLVALFEVPCDKMGLAEFSQQLVNFLDNPPSAPAVVGVTGGDTDRILHALSEPPVSSFVLRCLPGPGNPPLPLEQYIDHLQKEDCDVYLIVGTGLDPSSRATLVESLVTAGKHCMLIGGDGKWVKDQDANVPLEPGKRAGHEDSDLLGLRLALEKGVPLLVRERLLHSLPSIILQLVRRERRKLMMGIYDTCLEVCMKASDGNLPEALTCIATVLSNFKARYGLDDEALERMAQITGCPVEDLRSEVRCQLLHNPSEEQLLQMVSLPLSLSALVWSYIPLLGGDTIPTKLSPERMYRLLVESVWGMAEDAERVLLRGCAKRKMNQEHKSTCHWPCV